MFRVLCLGFTDVSGFNEFAPVIDFWEHRLATGRHPANHSNGTGSSLILPMPHKLLRACVTWRLEYGMSILFSHRLFSHEGGTVLSGIAQHVPAESAANQARFSYLLHLLLYASLQKPTCLGPQLQQPL